MNFMSTHTHVLKLLNLSDLLPNEFSPSTIKAAIKYLGTKHISRFMTSLWTAMLLTSLPRFIYHLGNLSCLVFTTSKSQYARDWSPHQRVEKLVSIKRQSLPATVQPYPLQPDTHTELTFLPEPSYEACCEPGKNRQTARHSRAARGSNLVRGPGIQV